MTKNLRAYMLLSSLNNCNALINFESRSAERELTQFGEWQSDHNTSVDDIQKEYISILDDLEAVLTKDNL